MTREIKFTPFGVPYILEFENVSFVPPASPSPPSPSSSFSSFCYIDSPPPPQRRPSFSLRSPFKRKQTINLATPDGPENAKPTPPPPQTDVSETNGIYIRFSPGYGRPQMSRKDRLAHLQQTISVAVLDAGMSRSPGNTARPEERLNGNPLHRDRGYRTPDALFCGTYGQMVAALEGAGLSATPCAEDSPGYTRLGALFVARHNGASGVRLRKITLWG